MTSLYDSLQRTRANLANHYALLTPHELDTIAREFDNGILDSGNPLTPSQIHDRVDLLLMTCTVLQARVDEALAIEEKEVFDPHRDDFYIGFNDARDEFRKVFKETVARMETIAAYKADKGSE